MSMPEAGDVAAVLDSYNVIAAQQSAAKDAYDLAQEAVATLRPPVDAAILDAWDDIDNAYRHDDPASLRRKAREWGVTYSNDPAAPSSSSTSSSSTSPGGENPAP